MNDVRVISGGRLRRGSISPGMKGQGSAPHNTPGLAIPSVMQGFTPGGHRDSSLYRRGSVAQNA